MSTRWSSHAYSADAIRAAEDRAMKHVTADELMDMAARAVAAEVSTQIRASERRSVAGALVVVLAGSGKNGGDALLAGAHLLDASARVTAVLCAESSYQPALRDFSAAGGTVVHLAEDPDRAHQVLAEADAVIDGIAGIGGRPGLSDALAAALDHLSPSARVVAVDVPSGVDVDTGAAEAPHVRAHATVTFGAPKPCHLLPPATLACGEVTVATLGIIPSPDEARADVSAPTRTDIAALLHAPRATDHKYTRPVVGVIAGDEQYPGAAVLTVSGAWRAGAGMVRYLGPRRSADLVLTHRPETVTHEPTADIPRVGAWVVGPGLGDPDWSAAALHAVWDSDLPCVADAAAVTHLARQPRSAPTVATPHTGELALALEPLGHRVTRADVDAAPVRHAHLLAQHTGATVLLKGAVTVVVEPDGTAATVAHAPPWLATAGAGDVLAGIIGTLLAGGLSPHQAAVVGAWIHGDAAHRAVQRASGTGPVVALDVASAVPDVIADLLAR